MLTPCVRVSAVRGGLDNGSRWGWLVALVCVTAISTLAMPPLTEGTQPAAEDLESLHGGAKVSALIDQVVSRQRSLRAMQAGFVQVKRSTLLLNPVRSTGEFAYLAPDRVRWDYHEPDAMVVLFADDCVTTYHPEQRRAERIRVSRRDRRFVRAMAGTLPLDDLTSHFTIVFKDPGDPDPYSLRLEPNRGSLIRKLDSLIVEVDRDLLLPINIEYNERDGDSTRYEFHSLELDPPLDEGRFLLEFGDEVMLHTIDATSGLG